jgi:predicted nuclease of predicted toxin-antitoxin system
MKILLDHCVDWRLMRWLPNHQVKSVREMSWEHLSNGKLLVEAAKYFDLIVTIDQKLKHEQNLQTLPIAVIVLIAKSSRLAELSAMVPNLENAIATLQPKSFVEVR